MNNVQVNMVAVILATLSTFVVGMIWYAKPLFGESWRKMIGLSEAQQKKGMPQALVLSLVFSFLTAYVLAHVTYLSNNFFHDSFMKDALQTAFWIWLGFFAATTVRQNAFEQRPMKLTLINAGNQLATLMVMGYIIGL